MMKKIVSLSFKLSLLLLGALAIYMLWMGYIKLRGVPDKKKSTSFQKPIRNLPFLKHGNVIETSVKSLEAPSQEWKPPEMMSLPSVVRYCNPPTEMILGKEGGVPAAYKLKLVHMIIRHGDRSSIHHLGSTPAAPISCKFDDQMVVNHRLVARFLEHMKQNEGIQHSHADFTFWKTYPDEKYCEPSRLTPIGVFQHLLNGFNTNYNYRKKHLFDGNFTVNNVMVRTTKYSRTFQSAIAFMFGFLPKFNFSEMNFIQSPINFCSEKLSRLQCTCKGVRGYFQSQEIKTSRYNRNNKVVVNLMHKVANIYNIRLKNVPLPSQIMDVFMGQICHNNSLPCNSEDRCISESFIDTMWHTLDKEGVETRVKSDDYQKFAHLTCHPLLSEIYLRMKNVTRRQTDVKFVLYSGHDVTLSPLLTVLGLYDGKWPPYASRLAIEMYTKVEDKKVHYFIRVLYNGEDQTKKLKFCKIFVDGMCKYKHFLEFVQNHLKLIGLKSYNQACSKF